MMVLDKEVDDIQKQQPKVLNKKAVLKNFAKFTGKHPCQKLFFNNIAGLRPATFLKKILWHRCFPVNFAKFSRTPFSQNTSGRLLLDITRILFNICPPLVWNSMF